MKIFDTKQTRNDYFKTQIARSRKKFSFCKVSHTHVKTWKNVLATNFNVIDNYKGPILCLGTRNGREIDLFRSVFYQNKMVNILVHLLEIKRNGWNSCFPLIEGMRKSSLDNIIENSVTGVELNPDVKRPDVFIGSFDEMPLKWADTFGILYSNSFDQSCDPYKSAKEWIRVLRDGGYFVYADIIYPELVTKWDRSSKLSFGLVTVSIDDLNSFIRHNGFATLHSLLAKFFVCRNYEAVYQKS